MLEFVWFAVVGKIVIFILQRFPFKKVPKLGSLFKEGKFFGDLFGCDLCLGVWVYSILAILCEYDAIELSTNLSGVLSWILTGMITSFVVHVFSAGWKALYNVTVIGSM